MNSSLVKLSSEQVARAIALAFVADVPVALWSEPGWGKSSVIGQVANGLKWKLYDFRLSDKEPSDIGGIPVPYTQDGHTHVRFAAVETLPYDDAEKPAETAEKSVVLLDEFDRADLSVQNVALQLVLDRQVNGHKLSKNARIVIAGNGVTDVGTSPLSKAAANRICHLYLDTESEACFTGWTKWAEASNISPELRSFAKYRREAWKSGNTAEPEQLAYPTPRSFEMADKFFRAADQVQSQTSDILRAIICGCVGQAAGTELLAWRSVCRSAPTIEEVVKSPTSARLPSGDDALGVTYAFTCALLDFVKAEKNHKHAENMLRYGRRLSNEQAAFLIHSLVERVPALATTAVYQQWEAS